MAKIVARTESAICDWTFVSEKGTQNAVMRLLLMQVHGVDVLPRQHRGCNAGIIVRQPSGQALNFGKLKTDL
jgi:hypothetical protein